MLMFERSTFESDFFGLNIYRASGDMLPDTEQIKTFAFCKNADLIRLKINAQHESKMNHVLEATGLPFYYSHSVLNVKADYSGCEIPEFKNHDLSFEKFDASIPRNIQRFYYLVLKGMIDDPIGYHKTPLISNIISKQKEAECYAAYYSRFYSGIDSNKLGFIMKKAGTDVGVFVFEIENDTIYTSMAALLPSFRSHGLFHDMKVFRQTYCAEHHIGKAVAGSRIANYNTPNTLLKLGYKIFNVEHVFHLPTLLSYSKTTPLHVEIKEKISSANMLQIVLNNLFISSKIHLRKLLIREDVLLNFKILPGFSLADNQITAMRANFPVFGDNEAEVIVFFQNKNNKTVKIAYLSIAVC